LVYIGNTVNKLVDLKRWRQVKIQEPSSECNTKHTAKPCSESFPTFFFLRCPCLTMVVYGHFSNTDLSN